ncbi:MAG TPA: GH3 auxin-responsive promoter family protein [Candidatus Solibacter sp.]|nr:GH3 auxin-responsive promoter family protein [Candidatus Solibacter sp.]
MLYPLYYRALNAVPLAEFRGESRRFLSSLSDPVNTQTRLLLDLLSKNRDCAFGRQHGFTSIRTRREYQERVPIVSYDDLAPWIERIRAGESGVLTSEPVLAFEKSSGSASAAKYIPYTKTLRQQFQSALAPWITNMHHASPRIARGPAYWMVTPLSRDGETTAGGIPVGFESDTEYFGSLQQAVLRRTMAVPPELAGVSDLDECLYLTLRFLLQARSLAFISVWSPTLLLILLDRLEEYGERLVRDLKSGKATVDAPLPIEISKCLVRDALQAERLRAMLRRGRIEANILWPELALISCWTSAGSTAAKSAIEDRFPGVPIQGKGLLATEGIVTIPLAEYASPVAAVTSHFLEFLDDSGRCHLVPELEAGREYSVLITTGGGLWRYRLGDRVRVSGFAERTPCLEFLGKEDDVSDLCGEKLNSVFVAKTLDALPVCRNAEFVMLAPVNANPPHYTLFIESANIYSDELEARQIDEMLKANPHYAYCPQLGQLNEVRIYRIRHAAQETYVKQSVLDGHRAGNIKTAALNKRTDWDRVFAGYYIESGAAEVCA